MPKVVTLSDYLRPEDVDNLIEHVCEIADMNTTTEDPAGVRDDEMDALITAARKIRDREGFLVPNGSEFGADHACG